MSDLINLEPVRRFPKHLTDYGSCGPSDTVSPKALRRKYRDLIAQGTPYAAMRLMEAASCDDHRVAVVAASQVLEAHRKDSDPLDESVMTLDTVHLTPEETEHALECAQHLARYMALSAERAAGIETVEG